MHDAKEVRWQHPERGTVHLAAFGRLLSVSINLSARNLVDHGLPELVAARLAEHEVDPRWLEVEVTETSAMTDPTRALEVLRRLSALVSR